MKGQYDAVVSVGMVEHVGKDNIETYMNVVNRCLTSQGVSLLHVIGKSNPDTALVDPWTEKYIFPGAYALTPTQIIAASEKIFRLDDVQEIGFNYGKTLLSWLQNIEPTLQAMDDQEFARMWRYYLASCSAMFYEELLSVWQFVFTKQRQGVHYNPVR
jgi:cyclopropane-fatty-acyl-phospholipid synthase